MKEEEVMHDEFNRENVSDMAESEYEQEGFRGEGSLDEKLDKMVTVVAVRIISEKSLKLKTSR